MDGELIAVLIQLVPELAGQLEKLRGNKVKNDDLNTILLAQLVGVQKEGFRKMQVMQGQILEQLESVGRAVEQAQKTLNRLESTVG